MLHGGYKVLTKENRIHTETGKENSMTFWWLLMEFHDLKIDKSTGKNNGEWNAPLAERFDAWDNVFNWNFFPFQPSAKNSLGTNLKFHDFSMTKQIFLHVISMTFPGLECKFQIPWLFMTMWTLEKQNNTNKQNNDVSHHQEYTPFLHYQTMKCI